MKVCVCVCVKLVLFSFCFGFFGGEGRFPQWKGVFLERKQVCFEGIVLRVPNQNGVSQA